MEKPDPESEIKSVIPSVEGEEDDLEESEATTESECVSEPDEVQHQEQNNENKEPQSEDTPTTSDSGMSELTLVLIGDTNSIEFGSNNILLDHDDQTNVEQFSSKFYDLCGRHISVINLLGVQSKNAKIPEKQRVHAFLLLLPDGLHYSLYSSGVQWLEKAFGRESLAHLMTVVTHETGETCGSALNDLKANPGFDERRFHTCRRSMTDGKEILDLLEKIDVMVSENDPHWSSEVIRRENKEHQEHKEEKTETSGIQQNQTEEREDNAAETKNDPLNEADDENTTPAEESEAQPLQPSATSENLNCCDPSTGETDEGKELISESSWNTSGPSMDLDDAVEDANPTSQTVSSDTTERTSHEDFTGSKEKQEKVSEEMNKKENQCQRETEALFSRLHLQDQQQQKLSSNFLQLSSSVKQQHEVSEKDLPHAFLHRLMMLDYRARYIPVRPDSPEEVHPKLDPMLDTTETDDSDLEAFFTVNTDKHQTKTTHVHPMDVQMAVFHCSDNFLKQIMITKLSQCQYALPLLVPDPFTTEIECPLWTFRHLTKSWKVTQMKEDSHIVTMKSIPICKAETPLVLFFRLGSLSVSKSQLMNTLINDRHNTFFHRNCSGSTKNRHLMDGVAEIAWYCPAGKDNDAFSDCIAFCNLHGDALLTEKQRDVLMEKSSVNVVLVPTLQKDDKSRSMISDLLKSQKPLICLVDDSCDAVERIKGKYKMGLKDKSYSDVSEQLRRVIGEVLSSRDPSSSKPTFQLETMAEVSGIRVDESDPVCQRGKSAAMEVVSLLDGMEVSGIKDKFLPCQGHLWHDWCRTNKELYHLKGHIEKERSKKLTKLDQIRKTQRDASCSELMKLFTKSLLSLSSTEKKYFLKWIQILVDALSTDDLSSILQSYDETWSEVLALKNNKEDRDKNSDLLSRKQTELEDISKKLQSATFGLEHIFREMGQIYEAHKTMKSKSSQTGWSKYPELAADLLISGHPMELMDGDAGHVPLIWISSLLDEVIKKLDDQRVFVLSVLGVQSSGKSTMLNAMFGLQFAVSAGRCTKGAFMQLVKVSEELKKEKDLRFDYILVVDTEGLRALELAGNATLHHDNRLATFVVGVGNMTIINIFGENPADMQDILQIVVQAFMRMKKVKLSPSCVFVHQNVTDIAAAEKNMDGKRRLQEKLDQMTELAAKEETSNAECFNDVIAFDVQKDVKYAAQLWEGSPPMAPPNPGYSESIQELKNIILSKASKSSGITFSQLKTKIKDLWDALLNENFVFSFNNTLEIAVYRKLEVEYGNWTWALRSNMLTIEDQLYTRIENGKLDKIDLNYLLKETSKTYEDIKSAMEAHFEDDENKEILVQWKGRFESKIKEFHDEQARGVKRKLEVVIEQKNACKKMDEKKTEFEKKLLQKSKELAHQLKNEVHDEEELKKQFSSVWDGWVHELIGDAKPVEDINFEDEQLAVLLELGIEWVHVEESKKSDRYKDMSGSGDYSDYVIMTRKQCALKCVKEVLGSAVEKQRLSYKKQEQIRELIINVEKESLDEIQSKPVATRGYGSIYLQAVAKNVKKKVTTFQSKFKSTLKNEFTVDLLLHVFDRMESWLLASQKTFKENNDALTYLESKKMQNYSIFRSFCKGNSSAVVLGELISVQLRASAADAVYNRTAVGLAGEMKCNFPAFNGNRLDFEKHLLKSLAENEDFGGFIKYIRDPRAQAEAFIKKEVDKYFKHHKDKAVNILKKNVDDINNIVSQALSAATQKVQTQGGDTEMWLSEFTGCLSDVLKFEAISSQNFSDINSFEFLQEEIQKGLKPVVEEMKKLPLFYIRMSRHKPDEILIDQLCKCCWVKCPFCAAVCTNSIEDHSPDDHSVPFHRPNGINGWHYRGTVELCINFCTTNVASDRRFYPHHDSKTTIPYKQYRLGGSEYKNWRITADDSKLPYWKWFVCRFQKKLEDHYKLEFQGRGAIPAEWKSITKDEAIESLDEM